MTPVHQLPNVGRESHTYLHHIVEHYDSLASWTVFSQAEAPTVGYGSHEDSSFLGAGHMLDGVSFHDYVLGGGPFADNGDERFVLNGAIKRVGARLYHRLLGAMPSVNQSGARVHQRCQLHGVEEHEVYNFRGFQWFLARKCFHGSFAQVALGLEDYVAAELNIRLPAGVPLFFSQGSRFAVHRERIHQRSKEFYERLMRFVDKRESPCAGFFNEWLWYYIMGNPSAPPC